MASNDDAANQIGTARSWLLFRPSDVLKSLPLEYRWEFTRRHPYYLQFWQKARQRYEHPSEDPVEHRLEEIAIMILRCIGVASTLAPTDPQLGPEALGTGELAAAWAGGAVAPAMLRTLAQMLLLVLPAQQRAQLGRLLNESAEYDSRDSAHMYGIAIRLAEMKEPVWDTYPEAPIVSINLEMPQRAITDAIEQLVRKWKDDAGIVEHRRRDEKLPDYLRVWDLREGWHDGRYDGARDMTLRAIAEETGVKIQTLIDRYRTAFRYLSGHDYSRELWIRLMGPVKLSRYFVRSESVGLGLRRPWRSPNLRPVTEAVLLPGRNEPESPEFIAASQVSASEFDLVDLSLDIETLIGRGRTDAEIIEELEIKTFSATDLLVELRRRHDDG